MKTYLEAINDILRDSGDSEITTIDLNDDDTLSIYNIIKGSTREILSNEYDFNYNQNFELTKNSDNEVELPNFLDFNVVSDNNLKPRKYKDGFYLYDISRNSFDFTDYKSKIYADITFDIDFEEIPFLLVQEMITKFSSLRYYMSINSYDENAQLIDRDISILREKVNSKDFLNQDANMFNNEEVILHNNLFRNF